MEKYDWSSQTWLEKAIGLCRLTPKEFLDLHLRKRNSQNVKERRWALRLALGYSRDSPDLRDKALQYRYSAWFLPVKAFCDYYEEPLTSSNGFSVSGVGTGESLRISLSRLILRDFNAPLF